MHARSHNCCWLLVDLAICLDRMALFFCLAFTRYIALRVVLAHVTCFHAHAHAHMHAHVVRLSSSSQFSSYTLYSNHKLYGNTEHAASYSWRITKPSLSGPCPPPRVRKLRGGCFLPPHPRQTIIQGQLTETSGSNPSRNVESSWACSERGGGGNTRISNAWGGGGGVGWCPCPFTLQLGRAFTGQAL
jgi:hypothetical protein